MEPVLGGSVQAPTQGAENSRAPVPFPPSALSAPLLPPAAGLSSTGPSKDKGLEADMPLAASQEEDTREVAGSGVPRSSVGHVGMSHSNLSITGS